MSMTGTERRLLKKARRLKTEIEMLTASRDLRIERESEKSAARRAEQLRLEGLRAAEESFESLGADEIRRAITEKRLREDRKSTRLNSSHPTTSRMPSSA